MLNIKPAAKPFTEWNILERRVEDYTLGYANQQIEYTLSHLTKERDTDSKWPNASTFFFKKKKVLTNQNHL